MKLKWGSEEIKYFNKKIPTAERVNWFDNLIKKWFWWVIMAVCLWATVYMLYKLYCLYRIQIWLENL